MSFLELHFPVMGASLPCDHGYELYAALSRAVPPLHENGRPLRIAPIRGGYAGNGRLQLDPRISRLKIRLPAEDIPLTLPLAGKPLEVGGHRLRLGVPQVLSLVPAPNLVAKIVVLKASAPKQNAADNRSRDRTLTKRYLDPTAFLEGVRRQLDELDIRADAAIPLIETGPRKDQPWRRVLRIHGRKIVGFTVIVQGLLAEESIRLQEEGVGGRAKMGCGWFGAMKEEKR